MKDPPKIPLRRRLLCYSQGKVEVTPSFWCGLLPPFRCGLTHRPTPHTTNPSIPCGPATRFRLGGTAVAVKDLPVLGKVSKHSHWWSLWGWNAPITHGMVSKTLNNLKLSRLKVCHHLAKCPNTQRFEDTGAEVLSSFSAKCSKHSTGWSPQGSKFCHHFRHIVPNPQHWRTIQVWSSAITLARCPNTQHFKVLLAKHFALALAGTTCAEQR